MTPSRLYTAFVACSLTGAVWAQVPNPTTTNKVENAQVMPTPVFRVDVVSRTIKSINYHHRQGSTEVGLEGSSLQPRARGEAKIDSKTGATKVDLRVERLTPAQTIGHEYLTYVAWAITPEGRAQNLGELMLDDDHARLQAATELQAFGLLVTAEPYYAVTQPSDVIVMEGVVKRGTEGTITPIEAKYELLPRGSYTAKLPAADHILARQNGREIPNDLLQARHSVAIANAAGASTYAADTMSKANTDLFNAEAYLKSKGDTKKIQTLARNVTQLAEDARIISVKKAEEERLEAERQAAAARVAAAQTAAEQEMRRRELAETERRVALEREESARLRAEQEARERRRVEEEKLALADARRSAEAALKEAERTRAEAEAQAAAARTEAQQANAQVALAAREREAAEAAKRDADAARSAALAEADKARAMAQQAEADRLRLRQQLYEQLNLILVTRESARGLIVNMSDVLFATGKADLKPGAREKLAKISGIVLAHPGLKLEVEGHTDSVGSDSMNQTLSERRAESVRSYLVSQGIRRESITARGFGESRPVADNNNAAGRQANRRVELVVSGEPIQAPSGALPTEGGRR